MKLFLLLLLVVICATEKRHIFQPLEFQYGFKENCLADDEVYSTFHLAYDDFLVKFFQALAGQQQTSFTTSPLSVWTTLAAIAEGADSSTQNELFTLLNLPKDLCSRLKFYNIAVTRISSSEYFTGVKALVIDDGAQVNPQWYSLIASNALLDIIPAPIRYDAATTTAFINKIAALKTENINLNSTSILLHTLNYNGLWNTAFPDAVLERAPFYNNAGEEIGKVDLMRVVRKARMTYIDRMKTKFIELTSGENNEYVIWIASPDDPAVAIVGFNKEIVLEVKQSLKDIPLPIDVAIPRFHIDTELDIKKIITAMGLSSNLWTSEEATRLISTPAATPSAYIEHTSVSITNKGVFDPTFEYPVYRHASKEDLYWSEFIVDKPFLFNILDKETYTSLLCGFYVQPEAEVTPVVEVNPVDEVGCI